MNRHNQVRYGLAARGSDDLTSVESRVSHQKLVRDDVVFRQVQHRDQALWMAIHRLEAERRRDNETSEDELTA